MSESLQAIFFYENVSLVMFLKNNLTKGFYMKLQLLIPGLTLIVSSFANAYIVCEGKKVRAHVVQSENGLLLVGNRKGQEAGVSFMGVISNDGMVFNEGGKALKDLKAVFAADSFNRFESGLDISAGKFYVQKFGTSKILLSDEDMKCEVSEGE